MIRVTVPVRDVREPPRPPTIETWLPLVARLPREERRAIYAEGLTRGWWTINQMRAAEGIR